MKANINNIVTVSTLLDFLQRQAQQKPSQIAYRFLSDGITESSSLTFQELDERAKAIAVYLQSIAKPGDRALMLYPSGLEFITAFLGCLYARIIAVPIYPPRSNHHLVRFNSVIEDAKANLILTTNPVLENIQTKFSNFSGKFKLTRDCWVTTENIDTSLALNWQETCLKADDLAFLQYTSGSTGNPKGVMVSHKNILHNQELIKLALQNDETDIYVNWLPLFHDMGLIGNVLQPIYLGISCNIMPPVAFLKQPINWLKAISCYKATISGGPNSAYDLCVQKIKAEQCQDLDLSSWKIAFNGAEPVQAETIEQFSEKFAPYGFRPEASYPCYGMAETTLFVAGSQRANLPVLKSIDEMAFQKNQVKVLPHESKLSKTLVSSGRNLFDKMKIVDPQTKITCQDNRVGEIWVASDSVTQGYWNREALSQETFKAYLADTGEGPFLRTGDLGFIANGEVFVTGRLKDVIIIRGRNYYPQDIELTVEKSHPALRPSCGAAFSIEREGIEKLIVVQEIERTHLRKFDKEEVFASIRRGISENHELQVQSIVLLKTASISKTSSGKIQRRACKKGFLEGNLKVVAAWNAKETVANPVLPINQSKAPNTALDIQKWMINWLAQALQLTPQQIDPQRPFADYGLDSVMAVEFAQQLGNWLGEEIEMTLVWNFSSIWAAATGLAKSYLSDSNQLSTPELVTEKLPPQQLPLENMEQLLDGMSEAEMAQLLTQELATIEQSR